MTPAEREAEELQQGGRAAVPAAHRTQLGKQMKTLTFVIDCSKNWLETNLVERSMVLFSGGKTL